MDNRIIKYFQGELTSSERRELLQERETNELLKKEFAELQNIAALTSLTPEAINKTEGEKKYQQFIRNTRKRKHLSLLKKTISYAAAICLIVVATWWISKPNHSSTSLSAFQQEILVPPGQRARITLPDGTTAWINAGSRLIYPSVFENERRVELSGEAYFDVIKNPDQPFTVITEKIHIQVLGTQFNVYCYPESNDAHISLMSGSVKIYRPEKEADYILMQPNQQLFYENGTFRLENYMDKDNLLWRDGIYSFKKERLGDIAKKLELYYDVQIIIKDKSILNYEYTGKFRQRDGLMEILRLIQKIHGFEIQKDEELNQITLR